MKVFRLLSAIAMFGAASSAFADDWSGVYVGGSLGGAAGSFDHVHENRPGDTAFDELIKQSPGGFVGGVQVGYRKQVNSLVFGAELGASLADLKETSHSPLYGSVRDREMALDNLVTATLEIGVAKDGWLFAARGGVAGGEVYTYGINKPANIYGSAKEFEFGYTVGALVEKKLTSNLSVGASYDFVSLNGSDRVVPCVNAACSVGFVDVKPDAHIFRLRLNYAFGN